MMPPNQTPTRARERPLPTAGGQPSSLGEIAARVRELMANAERRAADTVRKADDESAGHAERVTAEADLKVTRRVAELRELRRRLQASSVAAERDLRQLADGVSSIADKMLLETASRWPGEPPGDRSSEIV